MSSLILFSFLISFLLMIPLMSQPLSLGLVIMISTLLMCVSSAMTLSSWYGYILFLIYVGGLLVMFAYVAALSPNILFGSGNSLFLLLLFPVLVGFFLYFTPLIDMNYFFSANNFSQFKFLKNYGTEMAASHVISVMVGLAIILLINLVVVVKICYYQHSSLRPFS
uniref:NADH dehydrogenase subunit 6 n=1 Tax=Capulus dilatatus TaxID=3090832 RepID=UPI002A7EB3EA|nr:NADH dehydrogenase subunit 6 [Capulus dilatatus]WOW98760.1 NADH dehydrogenase subunit 6 [Capulus dilatatus]